MEKEIKDNRTIEGRNTCKGQRKDGLERFY